MLVSYGNQVLNLLIDSRANALYFNQLINTAKWTVLLAIVYNSLSPDFTNSG